jgi:hypothetical protein
MTGKSGGQPRRKPVAERHPKLTEPQRLEYNQRILDLVAERREEMARQKQQAQAQPTRSQEQGRGMEIER